MAAEINQSCTTAVGTAPEVYFFVAECLSHSVQVIGKKRRRVKAQIRIEFFQALAHASALSRKTFLGRQTEIRRIQSFTIQGVRLASATLVYQHDVALPVQLPEQRWQPMAQIRGSFTRPSDQHKH